MISLFVSPIEGPIACSTDLDLGFGIGLIVSSDPLFQSRRRRRKGEPMFTFKQVTVNVNSRRGARSILELSPCEVPSFLGFQKGSLPFPWPVSIYISISFSCLCHSSFHTMSTSLTKERWR